jgi:hypothetical protein
MGRQLIHASQKIWKDFSDEFMEEFEEINFFRTTKSKEQTEFLLDCLLICKVFIASKKKEDILETIDKVEVPSVRVVHKYQLNPNAKNQILLYNEMKEIFARTCAVLLSLI